MTPALSRTLNALGLLGISAVLAVAFIDQFVFGELPCPLCLLQRAGFVGVAVGLALNVRFGPRPSHYALVILAAAVGCAISVRQMLLHIAPGDPGFGPPLLGLHFYTWATLIFIAAILGSAAMLLFDRQFSFEPAPAAWSAVALVAVIAGLVMALGNGVSTVLECAGGLCPDNPTSYMLLDDGPLKSLLGR
ncbi:disulfide bond formation protein B [Aquabacter cavernae]|uniref:disulfide bond formation protein B n=1 Tax=Aquabacter cavernae TaxID=2496029 RepID=UPI000F8DE788|nr:disulfide bond formation protein B [Aquabacter cavernae]